MSIVKLSGGLGNQLFQYGFGIALQNKVDQETLFDITQLNKGNRKLEIDKLFPFQTSSSRNFESTLLSRISTLMNAKKNDHHYNRLINISEGSLIYNKEIKLEKNSIYSGSFISPQYWGDQYYEVISKVEQSLGVRLDFKSKSKIVLHIRRGDYFYSNKTRGVHGYCSDDFFMQALISAKRINPSINSVYLSTDSPELVGKLVQKIEMNGFPVRTISVNDPIKLLRQLVTFQNFIGSNSTLSWWAAALFGPKLTFFPKEWFLLDNLGFNADEQLTFPTILIPNALSQATVV
jgi:hypothetical protein